MSKSHIMIMNNLLNNNYVGVTYNLDISIYKIENIMYNYELYIM